MYLFTVLLYRWTSLYARDRDSKNMLAYNEFAYKKINNHCNLEDRFQKKGHFSIAYIRELADKKTAYNEGRLYSKMACLSASIYD